MLTYLESDTANFVKVSEVYQSVGIKTQQIDMTYGQMQIWFTNARLARDYTCDFMGRDFLDAEDYTYPHHGPNIHHWNSIEHFKVDGTVLGVSADESATALGNSPMSHLNYFNNSFFPAVSLVADKPLHACNVVLHNQYDRNQSYEFDWVWAFVPISRYFFGFCQISLGDLVYFHEEGKYSWNPYNINSTVRNVTLDRFYIYEYREDLTEYRFAKLDYTFSMKLSASSTSGSELAKVMEAHLRVALARQLRRTQLSRWITTERRTMTGIRKPALTRPNENIFRTRGRKFYNWPALAGTAYQSLGMADVNGIAYLKDLFEFGSACTSFASTLKSIPSKKVKAVAAAWLSVHYGFKLFLSDTKEILKVLESETARRSSLSRCAAFEDVMEGEITFRYGYQVYYDQWAKVRSMLEQTVTLLDLGLNLDNMWDMVPYSFVIDWFVDVGSVLKSLQNYAQLTQEHSLICAGRSIKAITKLQASQLALEPAAFTVTGTVSYYTRQYRDRLVIPSLIPSVTVNPFDHLIEAAALTIVRVAP